MTVATTVIGKMRTRPAAPNANAGADEGGDDGAGAGDGDGDGDGEGEGDGSEQDARNALEDPAGLRFYTDPLLNRTTLLIADTGDNTIRRYDFQTSMRCSLCYVRRCRNGNH